MHRSPLALGTLRRELASLGPDPSGDALEKAPYLGAVCNEAMRMHPVVPIVPRRALRSFTFRGHAIAPGQSVAVATTLLHNRADVWSDPARFLPERFLTRKYTPFEYAPFGGGARRCIGAAFAAYQMRSVLGAILARVRFEPHAGRVPSRVLTSIIMAPRGAVKLRVGRG